MNSPAILDVDLDLGQLLPADPLKGHKRCYQYWPRDIHNRRSLTTSCWMDVPDFVVVNSATVLHPGIPSGEFHRMLQ
jgi:hypothetical protein